MNHIKFSDLKIDVDNSLNKQELMRLKVWVCRAGQNSHGFPIMESALDTAIKTLVGKPVVAKYNKYIRDLEGHEVDEVPVGVFLSEDDIFFENDEQGVRWICAYATIWTRYAKDVAFVMDRDKVKDVSMEMLADMNENNEIVDFYFTGVTLIGVPPAIPKARAELMEFSALSNKVMEIYFASKEITNFPTKGENKKISLSNSNFKQFDHSYAMKLKEDYPEIWKKGGNIRGNEAFEYWHKAKNGDNSDGVQDWIKEREAWMARHEGDFRIAGVIAVVKWGGVVKKGESYMKDLINEEKKKLDKKKNFSSKEGLNKTNNKDSDIDTENFGEEVKGLEDNKEFQEKEVDMSANENVDPSAMADTLVDEAEANKEKSEEYIEETNMSEDSEVKGIGMAEETKPEESEEKEDDDDKEEDTEDFAIKYAKLQEEHTVMMTELEELRKFKMEYDEMQKKMAIEETMSYVSDVMPEEKMAEMREKGMGCKYSELNAWSNEVKAMALDFAKPQKKESFIKIGLNYTVDNTKQTYGNVWDKL